MAQVRVALSPNTHRALKQIALNKSMTLSGVVTVACIQYADREFTKAKPAKNGK